MAALSKILRSVAGDRLMFWCPGCDGAHAVHIGSGPGPKWTYNGDPDKPTFTPSILVRGTKPITEEERAAILRGDPVEPVPLVCHSFVTDGRIQFLGDCTHKLAGQTVDIPAWDSAF